MDLKFDSEPVCWDNDKYIKIKTKKYIYRNKVNTNFPDKKVPNENWSDKCLSLIMLDSVTITSKSYYH